MIFQRFRPARQHRVNSPPRQKRDGDESKAHASSDACRSRANVADTRVTNAGCDAMQGSRGVACQPRASALSAFPNLLAVNLDWRPLNDPPSDPPRLRPLKEPPVERDVIDLHPCAAACFGLSTRWLTG